MAGDSSDSEKSGRTKDVTSSDDESLHLVTSKQSDSESLKAIKRSKRMRSSDEENDTEKIHSRKKCKKDRTDRKNDSDAEINDENSSGSETEITKIYDKVKESNGKIQSDSDEDSDGDSPIKKPVTMQKDKKKKGNSSDSETSDSDSDSISSENKDKSSNRDSDGEECEAKVGEANSDKKTVNDGDATPPPRRMLSASKSHNKTLAVVLESDLRVQADLKAVVAEPSSSNATESSDENCTTSFESIKTKMGFNHKDDPDQETETLLVSTDVGQRDQCKPTNSYRESLSSVESDHQSTVVKPEKLQSVSSAESSGAASFNSDKKKKLSKKSEKNKTANKKTSSDSGNSSESDSERETNSKPSKPPEQEKKIIRLKKYLTEAGIRIQNFSKLWENCHSNRTKIQKLLDVLHDKGLKGNPTKEKCRKLRLKLEREREMAELDVANIVSADKRTTRAQFTTISAPRIESAHSSQSTKTLYSRIRAVVDSDSD